MVRIGPGVRRGPGIGGDSTGDVTPKVKAAKGRGREVPRGKFFFLLSFFSLFFSFSPFGFGVVKLRRLASKSRVIDCRQVHLLGAILFWGKYKENHVTPSVE